MAAKNETGNVRISITLRRVSATTAVLKKKKAIRLTYSECVSVAFRIRHAIRMRHIILSSAACLVLLYFFPRYPTKGTIVGKSLRSSKVRFDFLHDFCLKYVSF